MEGKPPILAARLIQASARAENGTGPIGPQRPAAALLSYGPAQLLLHAGDLSFQAAPAGWPPGMAEADAQGPLPRQRVCGAIAVSVGAQVEPDRARHEWHCRRCITGKMHITGKGTCFVRS